MGWGEDVGMSHGVGGACGEEHFAGSGVRKVRGGRGLGARGISIS